ncbi:MAG: UvrD-helicase domain-containing protein, partial [Firmicutes bacterium]|nr:UvrD-helicase domain-containing protein [Bacillota bacterium]
MKERIRQALIAGDYSSDMVNVLEQAHISTIHSFCQRLIADHPLQAEVDPRFRVAEEWESRGLLYQVTQAQLAYALADGKQGIIELCESRQPRKIVDDLVDIYERMVSKGTKDFNVEDDSKYLVTEITILRQELIEKVEHWLPWVKTQSLTESKQQVVLEIEGLWNEYNAGLAEADIAAEADILNELKSKFGGNWAKALKTQVGELKDLCEELNQSLTDLVGLEKLVHISSLLNDIDQEYQQHKLTAGLLDYNDLERLAVKLLADDDVVKDTYQFRYIMVDEAQDINPIQKQIIDLLTKDQGIKLFIVGDPKQSIYRFRGAEVELFLNSQEEILHKQGKTIALSDNFRSRPGIINFANQFFAPLLDGDLISYIPLIPNRDDTSCPAVELLITPRGENLDLDRQMEAERIAAYIQHLVYEQGYQYNEITVLFRTMTNVAIYERALQTRGIPFVNLSSWGFFEKQEIQDILSFVSWLQDSSDSISKIAVLRSPFFGVSDIGLYWYQADKPQMISDLDWEKINAAHQLYPKLQQALASLPAP